MQTEKNNIYSINLNLTLTGVTESKNGKVLYQVKTQEGVTMFVDHSTLQLGYCSDNITEEVELNKTELQSLFFAHLKQMIGKVIKINFYKQPDFIELHKEIKSKGYEQLISSAVKLKEYATRGENRTMNIVPLLDTTNNVKMRGNILSVLDADDNYMYKNIHIDNLNYFIVDKIYKVKGFQVSKAISYNGQPSISMEVVE